MPLHFVNADLCEDRPEAYKLCKKGSCVSLNTKCPCELNVEYRCRNGDCIPLKHKCDGLKHCHGGEDEYRCPGQLTSQPQPEPDGMSASLLVVLTSLCAILVALICVLVYVYVVKRRKNNTSRDSQSVTVPLKKKCVVESSDSYDKCDTLIRSTITDSQHGNTYKQYTSTQDKMNNSQKSLDSQDYRLYEKWKNSQNKYWGNIGLPHRNNEIYAVEHENVEERTTQKHGKYMFRPRLKSLDQEVCINPDDIRLNIALNSYRHFSGKISLPVTFEPEPETFASDLLCASTPRQPVRHLLKEKGSEKNQDGEKVTLNTHLVVKPNSEKDEVL